MRSHCTSAMKSIHGRAIGTECQVCGRLFGTLFAYDQHRRSKMLRGSACCAFPDENRMNVTSVPRQNRFTAALERKDRKTANQEFNEKKKGQQNSFALGRCNIFCHRTNIFSHQEFQGRRQEPGCHGEKPVVSSNCRFLKIYPRPQPQKK